MPRGTIDNKTPTTNGIVVAALCCSLIPILGWIFGGIGLSRASKRNDVGKNLSITALVISTIVFFVSLLSQF